MADNNGVRTVHGTLVGSTAETAQLTDDDIVAFEVMLRSGTGPIYFTWAITSAATVATVAGAETYAVVGTGRANAVRVVLPQCRPLGPSGTLELSLISATADLFTVHGLYAD